MNGAAIVAEILRREGTEFLSCYPRNPLIEACAALDIRPILCRQERVGVGMADGYTRIKRGKRNGVFAAQAGPGIENAFPGVAQAFSENVPLLMLPAGLPLARQYVRPVFRAADVYRPVTKWSALAHSVQELPDLMRRAYHTMRSGKGGPVLVEIPAEVWEAEYQGELDYVAVAVQRAAPDPDAIKSAVRMLLAAKQPLLLAGQGVPRSHAQRGPRQHHHHPRFRWSARTAAAVLGDDRAGVLHGLGQVDPARLRARHHQGGEARGAGEALR